MVLGVCGRSCSGKNAVCRILSEKGFLIVDADKLGQQALQAKKNEIISAFGTSILNDEGQIDRQKLGQRVFSRAKDLQKLNAISHPYVVQEMQRAMRENPERHIVLNAALLPMVRVPEVDVLIWVTAGFFTRLIRGLIRDRRGLIFTLRRMWMQRNLSPKLFFKRVDTYTIRNGGDFAALKRRVNQLLDLLFSRNQ